MKRQVEVFTAGCIVCEPLVKTIEDMACDSDNIIIYNLTEKNVSRLCLEKVKKYKISSLAAVAVDGQLLKCCKNKYVSKKELTAAGIGKPVNSSNKTFN